MVVAGGIQLVITKKRGLLHPGAAARVLSVPSRNLSVFFFSSPLAFQDLLGFLNPPGSVSLTLTGGRTKRRKRGRKPFKAPRYGGSTAAQGLSSSLPLEDARAEACWHLGFKKLARAGQLVLKGKMVNKLKSVAGRCVRNVVVAGHEGVQPYPACLLLRSWRPG
jgi:hypothetical protein